MSYQSVTVDFSGARLSKPSANESKVLKAAISAMKDATKRGYEDDRAFVNLCVDAQLASASHALAAKMRGVDLLVLIGIGGPANAVLSIERAIANPERKTKIMYLDTVDSHQAKECVAEIDHAFSAHKKVLVVIASKSGSTTETVANLQLVLSKLASHTDKWTSHVVVITDEGSPLWHEARVHHIQKLTIPKRVGGRYSVFSAMGLFTLEMLGVNTAVMLSGAASMRKKCLSNDIKKNPAAHLALCQFLHYKDGRNINDYFVFGTNLEGVGKWYRQLLAESCGKEYSLSKRKKVYRGITPTVCVGTSDLHSVGQLALGGPDDKFTMFVEVANEEKVTVPKSLALTGLLPHISGIEFHSLMRAIAHGTRLAYHDAKKPFVNITLPARNEHALGQLLQLHMMQTVYLAALLDVNAFDQPAVESYKDHARAIMARM